jgi:hypothetical protein
MMSPQLPNNSGRPSVLDRLAKFFTSLAGVITAAVLLAGAVGGAVALIRGQDDGGNNGTTTSPPPPPPVQPPPPPPVQPPPPPPAHASIFSSRDRGPGGTTVLLSGEGFDPGERVVLKFHTEEIGSTTSNDDGKFSNVAVEIPTSFSVFAPRQFDLIATGESSIRSARTPFTITG